MATSESAILFANAGLLAIADTGVFADATDHAADFCIADDHNRLSDRTSPISTLCRSFPSVKGTIA